MITWIVYLHIYMVIQHDVPKKRGIDSRLLDFIDYLCKEDKPPKEIRYSIMRKVHAGEWGPYEELHIPSIE